MARVKNAMNRRTRRKNLFRRVRGFFMARRKTLRQANEARLKAERQEFIGRKQRKRQFRRLWTQRINAAARLHGLSYSRLIHGLKLANVDLNRKMLADLAVHQPEAFAKVVDTAKGALAN